MPRHRNLVLALLSPLAAICAACGGATAYAPPPPVPDFSLAVSSPSLSISQGDSSSAVTFSISPHNGFNAPVQISLANLPAGVTSNPASPFTAAPGTAASVTFVASPDAATGTFTISAQGVSGALLHSANLALAVAASNLPALPRTGFVRTDASPFSDNPSGEDARRQIVYDAVHKNIFVANHAMNRLEIISVIGQSRGAQVAISGITSVDISADGLTLWAGTSLNEIVSLDIATLAVKQRFSLNGISPFLSTIFDRPVEVFSVPSGKCLLRLRSATSLLALLAFWDPITNVATNLTSAAPQLFQNGVGPVAHSGDHLKFAVTANDLSGAIALFDQNGALLAGPRLLGNGAIVSVAANSDGSRFAVAFVSNGASRCILLDAALNQLAVYNAAATQGLLFSRDGNFLYLAESLPGAPVITILDGHDLHGLGQAPDLAIQGITSRIQDVDETQLVFATSNRGISFIDAATPVALANLSPSFAAAPASTPSEGVTAGGTSLVLAGQGFLPGTSITVGKHSATGVNVVGSSGIQAISPANTLNGAVNVTAYSPNGWVALATDAFTYGTQILRVLPNTAVNTGGDTVQIFGYGFGTDVSGINVKIAGVNALVQSVDNVSSIAPALGLDISFPFSIERLTVQTPPALAGISDLTVTTPFGAATIANEFQVLKASQSFPKSGYFRFLAYDQKRQRVYLSNIDHVDVFDLNAASFTAPLNPPGGPPPNAGLRGIAMTPDGSKLLVADFGAQSVYVLDPDTGIGTTSVVGGVPGFSSSGPSRVAATSTETVFVGLSGEGGGGTGCSSCLSQMNLSVSPPTVQVAPQPEVSSIAGAPLLQANAAGDRVVFAFRRNSGGALAVWSAAAPNQFSVSSAGLSVQDIAPANDGNILALRAGAAVEIRNASLFLTAVPTSAELTRIPSRTPVPGLAVHPTGALIYQPFLTGAPGAPGVRGGVDISDAHSGDLRLRIFLPQQFLTEVDALHGSFLAIDENGQRMFAITSLDGSPQNSSLSVVQLAAVPLGIGSAVPPNISVSGGTMVTIRGSGFRAGITAAVGGKPAAATLLDSNTLTIASPPVTPGPQPLTLTGADGETVSLDAVFFAN